MAYDKLKLGVSLYSYADSFSAYKLDLEGCLKAARDAGYTGITIVAAQSCPEYPFISDKWLYDFREMMDKYNLDPVCWEGYLDVGMRSDRDLNEREIIEYTMNDIVYARKAGFKMMKTQHSISPETFWKMLPFCKEMDTQLTIEMHYPHHMHVPVWGEYIEMFKKSDGYLGCVPDLSVWQKFPHQLHINQGIEEGFRADRLEQVLNYMREGKSEEEAMKLDLNEVEKKYTEEFYHKNGNPADLNDLRTLLKYSTMIHGKFYYLANADEDPCIPQEEIFDIIKEVGYEGYMIAEYEGHHFSIKEDDIQQMQFFHDLYKKYLAK